LEAFLPICAVKVAGLNEVLAGFLWAGQVVTLAGLAALAVPVFLVGVKATTDRDDPDLPR